MRYALLLLVLAGCGSMSNGDPAPAAKAKAGPGADKDDCVQRCVQSRQMEARAVEDIEADCRKECAAAK